MKAKFRKLKKKQMGNKEKNIKNLIKSNKKKQ